MYYKTLAKKLTSDNWSITDTKRGQVYQKPAHYIKFERADGAKTVEIVTSCNRDGTPGEILTTWIDGLNAKLYNLKI